jgi:hypothetical protein
MTWGMALLGTALLVRFVAFWSWPRSFKPPQPRLAAASILERQAGFAGSLNHG